MTTPFGSRYNYLPESWDDENHIDLTNGVNDSLVINTDKNIRSLYYFDVEEDNIVLDPFINYQDLAVVSGGGEVYIYEIPKAEQAFFSEFSSYNEYYQKHIENFTSPQNYYLLQLIEITRRPQVIKETNVRLALNYTNVNSTDIINMISPELKDSTIHWDDFFDFQSLWSSFSPRVDVYFLGSSDIDNISISRGIDNSTILNSQELELGRVYYLTKIKDYDGNLHGSAPLSVQSQYKFQGSIDLNKDGTKEKIFTNKDSGRWASIGYDPNTGLTNFEEHGEGGITRVVGIYIDPLVTSGEVEQFGPHDSQRRFQNDLEIDNLSVKTAGDYDNNGINEVYWKTNDGTAYLRALMHDDGNIRYANYQSEEQMSEYLTAQGHESVIPEIV